MRRLTFILAVPVLLATGANAAPCIDKDAGAPIPDIALEEVAGGLQKPTHLTHTGDGSGRLFVVEQRGMIWVLEPGQTCVLRQGLRGARRCVSYAD